MSGFSADWPAARVTRSARTQLGKCVTGGPAQYPSRVISGEILEKVARAKQVLESQH
jgi:hypothetical protein